MTKIVFDKVISSAILIADKARQSCGAGKGKMNNKYLKDAYGKIFGVKNEKTISLHYEELQKKMDIKILVTQQKTDKNGKDYFNVYFIDPIFKEEPINNLHEQIPVENEPKNWEEYLTVQYINYWALRQFNYEGYYTKEN